MMDDEGEKIFEEMIKKHKKNIGMCSDLAEQLVEQINKVNDVVLRTSLLFSTLIFLCRHVDLPLYNALVVADVLHARIMHEIVDLHQKYVKEKSK